ncbi:MAG: hypothetical protein FWF43_04365 [Propionibacteriaceae bacterium]|nr:hypothetical protein [Propionibacteriaceae bacterium]
MSGNDDKAPRSDPGSGATPDAAEGSPGAESIHEDPGFAYLFRVLGPTQSAGTGKTPDDLGRAPGTPAIELVSPSAAQNQIADAEEPPVPEEPAVKRSSRAALVAVVVLALVVAGLVGWRVAGPLLGSSADNAIKPTVTERHTPQSATPTSVPVDLFSGLDQTKNVSVLGIWDGVAVFDMYYPQSDSAGFRLYPLATHVLRGVQVTTGEILWTLSKMPDHSSIELVGYVSDSQVWSGAVALSLQALGSDLVTGDATTYCAGKSYVVVLSLDSGDILSSRSLEPECTRAADGSTNWKTEGVVAYQDGIVVVDQGVDSSAGDPLCSDTGSTTAYRDTNLNSPLWTVDGSNCPAQTPMALLLSDAWVSTVSDTIVSIRDGSPATMGAASPSEQPLDFFAVHGTVLGAHSLTTPFGATDYLAAWTDLTTGLTAWTYQPDPGWYLVDNPPDRCFTSDAMIVETFHGNEVNPDAATAAAIRLSDGQLLWSVPYSSDKSYVGFTCTAISDGSKEYIAVMSGTKFDILDADTGALVAHKDDLSDSDPDATGGQIYSCGDNTACITIVTAVEDEQGNLPTVLSLIDYSSSDLKTLWSDTSVIDDRAYATDAGLVVLCKDSTMGYFFLIV